MEEKEKKEKNKDVSEEDVELEQGSWHGPVRCFCCRSDWDGGRDLSEQWSLKTKGASDNNRLMLASEPGAVENCCSPAVRCVVGDALVQKGSRDCSCALRYTAQNAFGDWLRPA